LGLKWSDVDLERGIISVQRSLHWRSYKTGDWYFGEPKTARSRRRIPLPPSVVRALVEHRRHQNEERLKTRPDFKNLNLVFATGEGQPLIRLNIVQKHFKPILERANLPATLRLYDLRHSCATLLLAANENPKVVSERLGHASITLTMDTYSHVMPDMQQGASDKLEQMLFTKTGTQ
jgi:integrase